MLYEANPGLKIKYFNMHCIYSSPYILPAVSHQF